MLRDRNVRPIFIYAILVVAAVLLGTSSGGDALAGGGGLPPANSDALLLGSTGPGDDLKSRQPLADFEQARRAQASILVMFTADT